MLEPGLHIFHGQPDERCDGIIPELDIVAVHGLNFKNNPNHARATWTWSANGALWIRDFLPFALKRPSRVLLFAYNSSPAMGAAAMRLDDHAKMLLRCLLEKREGLAKRPIVFLCHSLGGIVVKSALVEATLDPAYRSIVQSTRLLVFFATPHLGGNYSGLGDVAAKIVRTGLGTPGNDLLDGLKAGSKDVVRRFEQSRHLPEGCLVISFYETENFGSGLGLIVDRGSAILDLPEDRQKQVGLKANHSRVCKYPTAAEALPVMDLISSEFERALDLHQALGSKRENVHWLVPRSATPFFTGRDETISKIVKSVSPHDNSSSLGNVYVLTGMGGQGKSEICLRVLNQVRTLFWGIFWVDVSSRAAATTGFSKIAHMLGSNTKDVDSVTFLLSNCEVKKNWLLVLDNADDNDIDYQEFIPSGNRGTVLLTSRLPECQGYGTLGHEEIGGLSEEECVQVLFKAARASAESQIESEPTAKLIARELGFHTLALVQAGAYIALGNCSMEDYISKFTQERKKLLKFDLTQSQSRYKNVYATFEVSTQVLESSGTESSQDALCLLDVLSTFHYNDIPVSLFEDAWKGSRVAQSYKENVDEIDCLSVWHVSQLPFFVGSRGAVWDHKRLSSAISQLSSRALLKQSNVKGEESLSLHPLVHNWIAIRQDRAQRASYIQSSRCIVALARYGKVSWWPYLYQLEPHIIFLLKAEPVELEAFQETQIFSQICEILNDLSRDKELSDLLDQIFQRFDANPQHPEKKLLSLFYLLSLNQLSLGQLPESIETIQKVLQIQQSYLNEHHPDRLASQQVLARAYLNYGQWGDAISILESVRDVHESHLKLPKESKYRLVLLQQLGSAYNVNGQVKEAIEILKEVVSIQEMTMKPADPGQIGSKLQLAMAYVANCQTRKGIQLLLELDAIQREHVGENHPHRLELQKGLATAYLEDGQPQKAMEIYEKIGQIWEENSVRNEWKQHALALLIGSAYRMNGQGDDAIAMFRRINKARNNSANTPQSFATQYELGAAFLANGQTKDAIQVFEEVETWNGTVISSTHPSRLLVQADLSRAYLQDGQTVKAIALLKRVIKLQRTVVDESNPNLLKLEQRLGAAYLANGQNRDAIKLFERIFLLESGSHAHESDIGHLTCYHELGRAYLENGQTKEAISIFEEVVRRKALVLDQRHPEMLSSLHELGRAYLKEGQSKQGIQLCEKIIEIQASSLRENHPHQLKSKCLLASGLLQDNQPSKALEILTRIVDVEENFLDEAHPDILETRHLLGSAYIQVGQIDNGIATLQEVVQFHHARLNESHPTLLSAQHQLASAYMANGQLQDSIDLFSTIVHIQNNSNLPQDHPDRLASMHQLGVAYLRDNRALDALKLLEGVAELRSHLDELHPSRIASQHEVASCYLALDRNEEAVAMLEKISQAQVLVSRPDDPSRLKIIETLSTAYLKTGNLKGAIERLEELVSIRREILPRGDPSLLASNHKLGMAYLEDQQDQKGITILEDIIQNEETPLDPPSPLLLKTYYELGCAHLSKRNTQRAVELLRELSRLKRLHQDENYPTWDELNDALAMANKVNNRLGRLLMMLGFSSCVAR